MENASKALIIAGGILLALLILSTLIYVGTTMSNMADQQNQSKQLEQTAEFNRTYEAYNRSRLYGTDVMSVVNRAIEYNKQLDTDEEEYFINIVFTINQDFQTYKKTVTTKANGEIEEGDNQYQGEISLHKGTYEIKSSGNNEINEKVKKFFSQKANDDVEVINNVTTYTYSALSNFKNAIFTCEYVNYNESGRIEEMKFTQI